LEPVEEAIRSVFLPALLQAAEAECQRKLTAVSVRKDGLGLPDPTQSAPGCFAASEACTGLLVGSLREGTELDANMHGRHAGLKRRLAQKKQEAADERIFAQLLAAANTSTKRRMLRAKETGTWLTTMPNRLNATELSADEFQDSLWLRLRLAPLGLPDRCDGCSHRFSLGHAMTCKKGGLVLLCHNNVVAEWHHLCAQALSPAAVSDEPLIYSGRGGNAGAAPPGAEPPPELLGNIGVYGFWRRGATAIFDVRVTDIGAPYHRGQDSHKILAKHEKEKKDKYVDACLARRRTFTPLVFLVDGLRGTEASAATKKLALRF
jgi:hypothetical protein